MAIPIDAASKPATRLLGLDLLRLAALVLVLGRHLEELPDNWHSVWRPVVSAWHNWGGLGVDIFFVLSGFLVSGLLFAEFRSHGQLSPRRFYIRRAWKIYPSFYVLMAVTIPCQLLIVGDRFHTRRTLNELLFIQSYGPGIWYHTWSLAVEEHFYLLLPLLLVLFVRRNPQAENPFRALPLVVLSAAGGMLLVRVLNFCLRSQYSYHKFVFNSHLRMDSLLFGVLVAYAWYFHGESFRRALRPWRYPLLVAGVAPLGLFVVVDVPSALYYHTLGFTQFYLGAAAVLVGTLLCNIPTNFVTRSLAELGAYSYSIYLWHMALMVWVIPSLKEAGVSWQIRSAIYLVGAFAIGIAMAKLVELPLLAVRDRWFPSRSSGTLETAPGMGHSAGDQLRAA